MGFFRGARDAGVGAWNGGAELVGGIRDGGLGGLNQAIIDQADRRAMESRDDAIRDIRAKMIRNPGDPTHVNAYADAGIDAAIGTRMGTAEGAADSDYGQYYQQAAAGMRDEQGYGWASHEAVNRAMATNPYARYGVIGAAGVGGGLGITAGAQKLVDLMGLFEEAEQTEIARDQPLTS